MSVKWLEVSNRCKEALKKDQDIKRALNWSHLRETAKCHEVLPPVHWLKFEAYCKFLGFKGRRQKTVFKEKSPNQWPPFLHFLTFRPKTDFLRHLFWIFRTFFRNIQKPQIWASMTEMEGPNIYFPDSARSVEERDIFKECHQSCGTGAGAGKIWEAHFMVGGCCEYLSATARGKRHNSRDLRLSFVGEQSIFLIGVKCRVINWVNWWKMQRAGLSPKRDCGI